MELTDKDVISEFYKIVKVGFLNGPYHPPSRPEHYKASWIWKASAKKDVITFLHAVMPYLGHRRAKKATQVLSYYEATN